MVEFVKIISNKGVLNRTMPIRKTNYYKSSYSFSQYLWIYSNEIIFALLISIWILIYLLIAFKTW